MLLTSGAGCPAAGERVSASGNLPLAAAVNEPVRLAPNDGAPTPPDGPVALKEFTSAVPENIEAPAETICAAKDSSPTGVTARKSDAELMLKTDTGTVPSVCCRATPAPEGPEVPDAPPSSSIR